MYIKAPRPGGGSCGTMSLKCDTRQASVFPNSFRRAEPKAGLPGRGDSKAYLSRVIDGGLRNSKILEIINAAYGIHTSTCMYMHIIYIIHIIRIYLSLPHTILIIDMLMVQ